MQIHTKLKIGLVGCDLDLIDEISRHSEVSIVGYYSDSPKAYMPCKFLGNILYTCNSDIICDCILVGCDSIIIRSYCMERMGSIVTSYISPEAHVSSQSLQGKGSIVMANCYVSCHSRIGICSKLNIGVQVHHGAHVGNCSVLSPQTLLLGNSVVGEKTQIGARTVIRENVCVGSNSVIGMGSIVVNDIDDNILAYGSPCKPIRNIQVS